MQYNNGDDNNINLLQALRENRKNTGKNTTDGEDEVRWPHHTIQNLLLDTVDPVKEKRKKRPL